MIAVAAKPGGPEAADAQEPQGVSELIEVKTATLIALTNLLTLLFFGQKCQKTYTLPTRLSFV